MRAFALLPFLAFAALARADNAALTAGGHPRMMDHHPTVSMAGETVALVVRAKTIDTDATFTFRNDGPACTVRMGFPDFGLWAYAYPRKKAETMFKTYRSYVMGRPVATKLVLGGAPGEQWQVKSVRFPAHSTVTVREVYTTEVGGISAQVTMGTAAYLVHTGASWKGPIGKATITVRFEEDTELPLPFRVDRMPKDAKDPAFLYAHVGRPGGLVTTGPCLPTVSGRVLTFARTDWTPTQDDDVYVFYRYPPKLLAAERAKMERKRAP